MKNKIGIIVTIFVSLFITSKVKAASMNLSANRTTVTVGQTVTVTVGVSDVAGKFNIYSSNSNVLSGGGSEFLDNSSKSYTFTAKNVGTSNITAVAVDASDYNENTFSATRIVTINVVAPSTNNNNTVNKSSNNLLKSLKIGDYKLTPDFDKDTTTYNVTVPKDTEKITISAEKQDSKASISGTGEKKVTEGMNKFEVIVTAENGSKKTYTINVEVEEDPIVVKIGNKEYSVIKKTTSMPEKPNYYDDTTVKINDTEVPAYKGTIKEYVLVGLKDSEGNANLYIYNENNYTLYQEIKFNQVILYNQTFPKDKIPKNYKKYTETINEEEIEVYKLSKNSKYSLIYGMNVETGKENIYKYNSEENTLQLFEREEQKLIENKVSKYEKLIIILGGVIVILLLLTTIGFTRHPKIKDNTILEEKN